MISRKIAALSSCSCSRGARIRHSRLMLGTTDWLRLGWTSISRRGFRRASTWKCRRLTSCPLPTVQSCGRTQWVKSSYGVHSHQLLLKRLFKRAALAMATGGTNDTLVNDEVLDANATDDPRIPGSLFLQRMKGKQKDRVTTTTRRKPRLQTPRDVHQAA